MGCFFRTALFRVVCNRMYSYDHLGLLGGALERDTVCNICTAHCPDQCNDT